MREVFTVFFFLLIIAAITAFIVLGTFSFAWLLGLFIQIAWLRIILIFLFIMFETSIIIVVLNRFLNSIS